MQNEIIAYLGAFFIGITLALVGGGGSVLTVPIMVYLMHINPITSTAYSLFVVGTTAALGTGLNLKKGLIEYKMALFFALPAFVSIYLSRTIVIPALPDYFFAIGDFIFTKEIAIMILFSLVMFLAGYSMVFKPTSLQPNLVKHNYNYPLILISGFFIGLFTGLVGAGGGFIIIPALVLLVKLPMKRAVATSLFIVTFKSLIGFSGDIGITVINWYFLICFSAVSCLGMLVGNYLSNFIAAEVLKKIFGTLMLVMSIAIVLKEICT